jgi:hypothetical protein
VVIFLQSPSAIRHAFYEVFLHVHIILSAASLAGIYVHLNGDKYNNERAIIMGVLILWIIEVRSEFVS